MFHCIWSCWTDLGMHGLRTASSSNRWNSFSILNSRAAWNALFLGYMRQSDVDSFVFCPFRVLHNELSPSGCHTSDLRKKISNALSSFEIQSTPNDLMVSDASNSYINLCLLFSEKKKLEIKLSKTHTHKTRPHFTIVWHETWLSCAKCLARRKQSSRKMKKE